MLTFILMSMSLGLQAPATLPFSCATSHATLSESDLRAQFGDANVTTAPVPWGGAEGEFREGTLLFIGQPEAELSIYWQDGADKRQPEWVSVRGTRSRWQTGEGITLGTRLTAIERSNGRPFRVEGFGHDLGGTVTSWAGG